MMPFTRYFQIDFFPLCISAKSPIFLIKKKTFEKCTLCEYSNCFWLGVVIELLSSNWKVIASCADSYITEIFLQLQACN